MGTYRLLVPLALIGILLSVALACAPAATPTPTPQPTPTPTATPTPAPTKLPTPTPTPGSGIRQVAIGAPFQLKAFEPVEVATAFFVFSFEVTNDSRCPKDVVCVWAGEAAVKLTARASTGASETFTLKIGPDGKATATFQDHPITLSNLQPYPVSSLTIDSRDYEATVVVG